MQRRGRELKMLPPLRRRNALLLSIQMMGRLHYNVNRDIVGVGGAIVHGGHGTHFQLAIDFGLVVDEEPQSHEVLTLFYVHRERGLSDGRDSPGDGTILRRMVSQLISQPRIARR